VKRLPARWKLRVPATFSIFSAERWVFEAIIANQSNAARRWHNGTTGK